MYVLSLQECLELGLIVQTVDSPSESLLATRLFFWRVDGMIGNGGVRGLGNFLGKGAGLGDRVDDPDIVRL